MQLLGSGNNWKNAAPQRRYWMKNAALPAFPKYGKFFQVQLFWKYMEILAKFTRTYVRERMFVYSIQYTLYCIQDNPRIGIIGKFWKAAGGRTSML